METLARLLLPELARIAPEERAAALRGARATPLDAVELVGIAAGLVVVTALTRSLVPEAGAAERLAGVLLNFALGLPMLGLACAPFHLRRLRRGLRDALRRRGGA